MDNKNLDRLSAKLDRRDVVCLLCKEIVRGGIGHIKMHRNSRKHKRKALAQMDGMRLRTKQSV